MPAAVALKAKPKYEITAREMGQLSGIAPMKKLSPAMRSHLARRAANTRWRAYREQQEKLEQPRPQVGALPADIT